MTNRQVQSCVVSMCLSVTMVGCSAAIDAGDSDSNASGSLSSGKGDDSGDGSGKGGGTSSGGGTPKTNPTAPPSDPQQALDPKNPNPAPPMSPQPGSAPDCSFAWLSTEVASGVWVAETLATHNINLIDPGRVLDIWMVDWNGYCCYAVRWLSNTGNRRDYQVATDDGQVIGLDWNWR